MDIVLGAGIAGLGAYYANPEAHIFEQNEDAGGLCRGFEINSFHFDNAVHLSFTKIPLVRELFDRIQYTTHHPQPYSWFNDYWTKHPAQNNLFPFPADYKIEAIKGFLNRQMFSEAKNFVEWNKSCYGEYLWDNLFKPYNEKYWCVPLEQIGLEWIGKRFYQPTLDELLYGSYTDKTPNTYYAPEMRYPNIDRGGYYAFMKPIAERAEQSGKLHYNKCAVKIDTHRKKVTFSDGSTETYEKLYSSIPLPKMYGMILDAPQQLKEDAGKLEHTQVIIVSFYLKEYTSKDKMWFYIYDKDIKAARAYFPSVKSEKNAPVGCASIQFEIYLNGKENVTEKNMRDAVENCYYTLEKMKISQRDNAVFLDCRILPYGNIIPLKKSEETVPRLVNWLENNGVTPIGRFGRWSYYWSDQAFMSGYDAVKGLSEK